MKWEDDWVTLARNMIREEFDKRYANRSVHAEKDKDGGSGESGEDERARAADEVRSPATTSSFLVTDLYACQQPVMNIFEALENEDIANNDVSNELTRYLSTDPERVKDALQWWNDCRASFPNLSRMVLDYLSIPGAYLLALQCISLTSFTATSVEPERTFSRGRLALPHTRNRLAAQSTCALMCVGNWSVASFVHPSDARKAAQLDEVEGGSDDSDFEMEEGWDKIDITLLK